ncbi:MAG TPA: class I SAM-dependent methyltransferase [Opitutales bacterium]|nr:class I SAM-dependent methyltransferase [Opitutales bacterium]
MDSEAVKSYYRTPSVLDHYTRATTGVGLWLSEKIAFTRHFGKRHALLELGTGTGRIALALEKIGYEDITAIDLSEAMIGQALRIVEGSVGSRVRFSVADACALPFGDNAFDGAIFGFNGMMQIPGRQKRRCALREVLRVIRPGSRFIFTTHDRDNPHHRSFWEEQGRLWAQGRQDARLEDFGDRYEETPLGMLFIHIPSRQEIREDIEAAGFRYENDTPRSLLANENEIVREFADDCRFWIVRKPKSATGE